ncbi:MAG: 2-oxoglutarate dehydrogenase E1 component, partial [Candidatus Promineifilaceae bacterium]|nr:2-oxoglutarate dehydrogenase E1 component [Candidatus Promineifilaceae bacterium]
DLRALPPDIVTGPLARSADNAWEAINRLYRVYTGTIGYDYEHIRVPEEREWLRTAAESGRFRPPEMPVDREALLQRLTQVEVFELFLHRFFPGKTRFSIEGLDMMVPVLDEIIREADRVEVRQVLLGMAHRGRLNVLAHILNKPYEQILAEFKDPASNFHVLEETGWTGDVKYHSGKERVITDTLAEEILLSLAPNPSHLEHVNPVVLGMTRAAGSHVSQPGAPTFDADHVLSLLIHGDAAFIGQGIVAETLNLSRLRGYQVGGTIHIIANNQLGYTTTPLEARSTLYASDLAKGFKIPIIHVNADDPIACLEAARTAIAYRTRFHKDFLIDLIGYRRHGHNEGDEPTFTQPRMYEVVEQHPTVRTQLAVHLADDGVISAEEAETLVQEQMNLLQQKLDELQPEVDLPEPTLEAPPPGAAKRVATAVPADTLRALNEALLQAPRGFQIHRKIARGIERRREALDDEQATTIDWATAEDLALGSILAEGIPIRFTGEDVERGTFSHRHAVWRDVETGEPFTPLQSLPQAQAAFEIHNSPLSENGVLGFEYGYDVVRTEQLVIWEAQFGDFINVAQAIIDEFIVSGRAKWEQTPALTLLLPHGYEGQGPDHSTGRLERFLQLAAEINSRVVYPSNSAQYFHLLRRQALLLGTDPLPLIVMSPKSLLRHPLAASSLSDLAHGGWRRVIEDPKAEPEEVRRLLLCSGKIYVDLISSPFREHHPEIAIGRLEQLAPFPYEDARPLIEQYPHLETMAWVQEEPRNMGAWEAVRPHLENIIDGRWPLNYVGRPRRASPAEGSMTWHKATQAAIVEKAFSE